MLTFLSKATRQLNQRVHQKCRLSNKRLQKNVRVVCGRPRPTSLRISNEWSKEILQQQVTLKTKRLCPKRQIPYQTTDLIHVGSKPSFQKELKEDPRLMVDTRVISAMAL